MSKTTVTHQKRMPLGWVNRGGRSYPAFICSVTGKPITPENPGVLHWHPVTGAMVVLSDEAEDRGIEPSLPDGEGLNSMEIDVLSQMLYENSAGKVGTPSNRVTGKTVRVLRDEM